MRSGSPAFTKHNLDALKISGHGILLILMSCNKKTKDKKMTGQMMIHFICLLTE
jgi:hypothetical protein